MTLNKKHVVLVLYCITTISPLVAPLIPTDIKPLISQQGSHNTIIFSLSYNK